MNPLQHSSKKLPCPVCNGTNAACKSRENFVLCMTEADSAKFEIVNGWKNIGISKDWAQFVPADQKGRDPIEAKKQSEAKAKREALYKSGLNATERHTNNTALLAQLSLNDDDLADLLDRGVSCESLDLFRSIEPGQTLSKPVDERTPGVGFGGRKLLNRWGGYLVPARDLDGNITAFQIRSRDGGNDAPKYPWLSVADVSPANLSDGEMPLTFARGGNSSTLYLNEGILKPIVSSDRLGINVIGASGGLFASSPNQFREWIEQLNPSELILCPDGGDIANPKVMGRIERQFEFFAELELNVKILWWDQQTKADGDVDEISVEQFEKASLISWAEFAAKNTSQRISAPLTPAKSTKPAAKKQTKKQWLEQQRKERDARSYAQIAKLLDIEATIDTGKENYQASAKNAFYQPLKKFLKYETHGELVSGFAEEMQPAEDGRSLLAYDCSQGTGKSNNALIPAALRVAKADGKVLIIVPTRGLAREFKGRINEQAGTEIAATHLDPKYYSAAIIVTCPESAYKFKNQRFDLIQIDEVNEGTHRIESAELGNAGPQSLAAFRKILPMAQTVAIATAAMSGWTLAAIQSVGGFTPEETQLQRRIRPATEMQIIEYSNFYQWLQKIIDALRSGQRVAIPVGSQGKGRMIDRILRALFAEKSGLVIDGKATLANQRTKFLSNPDAFLSAERPDWFIFTPVINSGVSIEGQHFDIQFEYATPHEGAQSVSQRGERIRSAIGRDGAISERHIYFSEQGAPSLEAYPNSFDWQYWADELADDTNAPMGAAAALAKALGAEKALKPMEKEQEKFAGMRPNLPHFLALKAFEIIFKKELLHEDWARFGWDVAEAPQPDKEERKELSALKQFCDQVRIGLIKQEGRTLKKAQTREGEGELDEINNPFQAARMAKAQIERVLGKEFCSQQDEDFYTAWVADKTADNPGIRSIVRSQLLQIAVTAPDHWAQIERMKALKFLAGKPEADSELFWHLPELPASARDIELAGIISRCPGVKEVLTGKLAKWTNKDPLVVAAGLYLVAHGKQIAANTKKQGLVRGAKFSEQMAPTALFNKALELMGYAPHKVQRQGTGKRLNVYRLANEGDAVKALAKLKENEEDSALKLFRAELKVIRAQTRESINQAAHRCIMGKFAAWGSEAAKGFVQAAEEGIRARHADLIDSGLSKLGDVPEKPAETQRELVLSAAKMPPPKSKNIDPLADDYYDAAAWGW